MADAITRVGLTAKRGLEAASDLSGVEIRLFCRPGFTGAVELAEIAPAAAA